MHGFFAFFAAVFSLVGSLFGLHPATSTSPMLVTSTTTPVATVAPAMNISSCQGLLNTKLIQCYTQVATTNKDLSTCNNVTDYIGRDECYTAVAVATQDTSGCYQESDSINDQGACFSEVAAAKNDLSICDATKSVSKALLTDGGYQNECYAAVAAAEKDPSICGDIPTSTLAATNTRDDCYMGVASSTQNVSICANITDASTKAFCIDKANPAAPSATSCTTYSGAQKDMCLYETASLSSPPNPSLCGQISTQAIAQQCYARLAETLQNSSLCDNIASSTAQAACIAAANPPTAASCASLPASSAGTPLGESSAECYTSLAQYYYDDSYCASISPGYGRNYCYTQASYETSDPATCAKIVGTDNESISQRNQCYQVVGETLNDPSVCLKIKDLSEEASDETSDESQCLDAVESATRSTSTCSLLTGALRERCYSNIAFELNDVSLCSNVVATGTALEDTVQSCIWDGAIVKNDPSLCTGIPAGTNRDECYYQVGWLDANPSSCAEITKVKAPNSYTSYPPSQQACYAAISQSNETQSVNQ